MSSGYQEPVGTTEHLHHNLALPEPCRVSFIQGTIGCGLTNRDLEFPVRVGCEEQEIRVGSLSRTGSWLSKAGQEI